MDDQAKDNFFETKVAFMNRLYRNVGHIIIYIYYINSSFIDTLIMNYSIYDTVSRTSD